MKTKESYTRITLPLIVHLSFTEFQILSFETLIPSSACHIVLDLGNSCSSPLPRLQVCPLPPLIVSPEVHLFHQTPRQVVETRSSMNSTSYIFLFAHYSQQHHRY